MEPITREEKFLAAAAGDSAKIPMPITRQEKWLEAIYDRVSMGGVTQDQLQVAVDDYFERNPVEGDFVKTVNGKAPDARGNVQIETGGGSGLTSAQINALDGMFRVCAYDESKDYVSAYAAFKSAFGLSGSGGGGEEEPETPATYSILNTLTNVTSSNTAVSATGGNPYFATLTPADGHTIDSVIVTMGGVDISATAVNGAEISISSVTGDIVIIATAAENQAQPVEMTQLYMYGSSTLYSDAGETDINVNCETQATSVSPFETDTIITFEYTNGDAVLYGVPRFACVESPVTKNSQSVTGYYAEQPTQAELGSSNSGQLPAGEKHTYTYTVKAGYYLFIGYAGNFTNVLNKGTFTITGKAV